MKIAVDVMGGDHAPNAVIEGALLASEANAPDTTLVLVGQEEALKRFFPNADTIHSNIEIVYASQVIEMHEHPVKALPAKPDSSARVSFTPRHQALPSVGCKIPRLISQFKKVISELPYP
jgi:glycerol-3-phosphate acyltransferase PlsX